MEPHHYGEYIYAEQVLFFVVIFIIILMYEMIESKSKEDE